MLQERMTLNLRDINGVSQCLLSDKDIKYARKQAIDKFLDTKEPVSSYICRRGSQIYQLELICMQNAEKDFRVFAIDKSKKLGQGAQGIVYLSQELQDKPSNTSDPMSIVKISENHASFPDFIVEENILKHLERFKGSTVLQLGGEKPIYYLFSQFCPGTNLLDTCYKKQLGRLVKKKLDPLLTIRLIKVALTKVNKLHQNSGVLHRDLKTENIIVHQHENGLVEGEVIDFGRSCLIQQSTRTFSGTIGYQARETTRPRQKRPVHNLQAEYFSLGIIMAEILTKHNYQRAIAKYLKECERINALVPLSIHDIRRAMPDVFFSNQDEQENWKYQVTKMIQFLTQSNPNKRPTYLDIYKMIQQVNMLEEEIKEQHPTKPFSARLHRTDNFGVALSQRPNSVRERERENGMVSNGLIEELKALSLTGSVSPRSELTYSDSADSSDSSPRRTPREMAEKSSTIGHFLLRFSPRRMSSASSERSQSPRKHARQRSRSEGLPRLNMNAVEREKIIPHKIIITPRTSPKEETESYEEHKIASPRLSRQNKRKK
tara:strand:+ start:10376 stop:12013 length:1638 start_codon:yes stop_codon:yes gene_type:complete